MQNSSGTQSLFETNIRLLGGLNGAHSLAYVLLHFYFSQLFFYDTKFF